MTTPELDLMDTAARRELLTAYLDGELGAEDALAVSQWLDSNPGALREVEHMRHLWDLLETYEDEPVPESFAAGVLEAVGIERVPVEGGGKMLSLAWYRRPLATAAAVLVAIGATVLVMSQREAARAPQQPTVAAATGSIAQLEALGVDDLETLEYLHVIVDADDEAFEDLLADNGFGG